MSHCYTEAKQQFANHKAKKALDGAGLSYTESDVIYVELKNAPGALGQFAEKLAAKSINITLGY